MCEREREQLEERGNQRREKERESSIEREQYWGCNALSLQCHGSTMLRLTLPPRDLALSLSLTHTHTYKSHVVFLTGTSMKVNKSSYLAEYQNSSSNLVKNK